MSNEQYILLNEKKCRLCKHFERTGEFTECKQIGFDSLSSTEGTPYAVIDAGTQEGGADYARLRPVEDFGCVLWEEND